MPGKHLTKDQRGILAGILAVPVPADASGRPGRPPGSRAIAAQVGVSHSTILRELRRDGASRATYSAWSAQLDADAKRRRPKPFRLLADTATGARLRREVAVGLRRNWSPQQVSGRLKRDHPGRPELHMSHTAIYRSIYILGRQRLLAEIDHPLRRGGQARRPRGVAYSRIKDPVSIHDRPAEADARVPGHWEGDLIKGKNNASAIATLVERATRFTLLVPLPQGWKSHVVADALAAAVTQLPAHLWSSLTWDRGLEMAAHARFTIATGVAVYFADPHSPWQRPTNENTNGLLRQYLPKGSDLNAVPPERLTQIQHLINGRPRKVLQFATPAEALDELIAKASGATTP
jgi:IS30 family transposase